MVRILIQYQCLCDWFLEAMVTFRWFADKYRFSVGTAAGLDDVIRYRNLTHDQTSYCADGLNLQHKRMYFASVTAINGALTPRNVTAHSDGGKQMYVGVTPCLTAGV